MFAQGTYGSFFERELASIGAPHSHRNFVSLLAWALFERTACRFNPQATTEPWPGASDCNPIVKNYPDEGAGVGATTKTLLNGFYNAIVRDLHRSDRPRVTCRDISRSPWGSHPSLWHIARARTFYKRYLNRKLPPNGSPI